MSIEGVRVVRGPNWSYGNDDGGEGHVGTVTQDNQDDTLEVQWDMGQNGTYNSGKDGKCDLRILDSSPTGIQHTGVTCDGCSAKDLIGTRWKCSRCADHDLCTACYFGDKHEISHPFLRIDAPGLKGELVLKRSASVRQSALGIFKNAEVKRGVDWNGGNQDGGSGNIGKIQEVKAYTKDSGKNNGVTVKWKNGQTNTYRLGYRGKVDLECTEETPGMSYYRDHLFPLSTVTVSSLSQKQDSAPPPPLPQKPKAKVPTTFKVGEKVCIEMGEIDLKEKQKGHGGWSLRMKEVGEKVCIEMGEIDLKEKQKGHGGWSLRMKEYIGQHGTIHKIEENGDCVISYDGKEYRFNSEAIRKVPSLKLGDTVRILDDSNKVQALQKRHGGWQPEMNAFLGKVGKVIKMDSDGDVAVGFGTKAFVYNPACCEPAPGAKPMAVAGERQGSGGAGGRQPGGATGGQGDDDDDDSDEADEAADALGRLIAQMFLLQHGARSVVGPQVLVQAAANNDVQRVKEILSKDKKLVDQKFKNLTALIIASHEGHMDVVKVLLDNGAHLEMTEDKGNTALMAALMKKREQVALLLIAKGANVNTCSIHGRNALHCAATNGATESLKKLLEKGCDLNKQDSDGDTPIHDAITTKENTCVAYLLASPNINLRLCNKKGFSPLHFAALKDDDVSVEKILGKAPELKDSCRLDGNTALHIAAVNDNIATIKTLLRAHVNVNARTAKKYTPLHLACHRGYIKAVELLVSNSADVKAVDEDGDTPLHNCMMGTGQGQDPFAILLGIRMTNQGELSDRHQIAMLLIKSGASVKVTNNRGKTPLDVCSFQKLTNAVKLFAEKHEETHGGGATARGRVSLADLLLDLPIPCMGCMENIADARFMPCKHKVCCKQCAFKTRQCPACDQPITDRFDMQGRKIVMVDPCKVQ